MIAIRPAEPGDIAALQRLDTVAQRAPHRAEHIARWVSSAQCLCAVQDDAVLGYAVVDHSFFSQPMLEMVMVGAAARGQGIGRRLILAAIDAMTGSVL